MFMDGSIVSDRSKDILGDMSQPRVFSLQKLVEVADFNMDSRGRIVWANIWGVLSQHFSALGAHSNRYVGVTDYDYFPFHLIPFFLCDPCPSVILELDRKS